MSCDVNCSFPPILSISRWPPTAAQSAAMHGHATHTHAISASRRPVVVACRLRRAPPLPNGAIPHPLLSPLDPSSIHLIVYAVNSPLTERKWCVHVRRSVLALLHCVGGSEHLVVLTICLCLNANSCVCGLPSSLT